MVSKISLQQMIVYPQLVEQIEKGFFGKQKIRFGNWLHVCGYAYETAALASSALVDKSFVLAQILTPPGSTKGVEVFTPLKDKARTRRESFPNLPSLGILIMESELNDLLGLSMLDYDSMKKAGKAMSEKWDNIDDLDKLALMICEEGFAFGLEFPEETRDMYRNAYEKLDKEEWALYYNAGLNISKNPPPIYTLEQRENEILTRIAEYVHEYRPELEDSLDLKHLLS